MISPTRDVKVRKERKLLGAEKLVEKIEVELYKNDEATGKRIELNEENNWSGEFKNLEVAEKFGSTDYYKYTVKEVGESGNVIKLNNVLYKVSYKGNMDIGIKIINEKVNTTIPNKPQKPNKDPNKPEESNKSGKLKFNNSKNSNKKMPKTGYELNSKLYIGMAISFMLLAFITAKKKRIY
ncbi:Cna B-type domain-containing protein, partial [Mesomycoplasma ovipneumoniae]|uniref:Cna B-type domain-containing protein n=1 Tax=Mesomycoplasma ovipneumoniae TaxID=29562 RepID=UPI0030801B80